MDSTITTKSTQLNTTQPTDWVDAWRQAADAEGVTLSEWIGAACNKALPREVLRELGERPLRGKRTKKKGNNDE